MTGFKSTALVHFGQSAAPRRMLAWSLAA